MPAATSSRRWRTASDEKRTLAEHLRELRKRLVISAIAILVSMVAGYFLAPFVLDGLRAPISQVAEDRSAEVVYTTVTAAFDLRLAISATIGIVIASPVWLYQLFAFLVPGLSSREKRYTFGFFFSAVPLFLGGAVSGWLVFPHMVELLTAFASQQDATFLDARTYYDFVIKLVLAVGVAFVLPVFLVLLNFLGVLSARAILKGWRIAVLLICLFTALATPAADIMSMFLLAVPMVVLYFAATGVAAIHDRRLSRRLDALASAA